MILKIGLERFKLIFVILINNGKLKGVAEGDFIILDIYKEKKRDLPILLCKNDTNDERIEEAVDELQERRLKE